MTKSRIQSIIGLTFFLIILPVGTYLFLRSGFEYRRESLAELKDLAPLDTTNLQKLFSPIEIDFEKAMFVFGALDADNIDHANKIYNQFKNRDDVFHVYLGNEDSFNKDTFEILNTSRQQVELVTSINDYVPEEFSQNARIGFLLGDYTGYIRRIYNYDSKEDMGLLIEHMAMKLKSGDRKEIMFQREVEK